MRRSLRQARALLLIWFAHMSAYRAEIVIWILTGSLPLIMMAIWISKAQQAGGVVNGMTGSEFAAYFLAAWLTQQLIVCWVAWELDRQIRLGQLSPKLLRPLDVMWDHLAAHLAERLVRTPFMLLVLAIGIMAAGWIRLTPDVAHVVVYLISVNLAFAIRFLIAYSIGILGFWFDQATALEELYFIVAAFLTGSFAPISLYPQSVQHAIGWTPFPYLIYHPVRILTGTESWSEIGHVLLVQTAWLMVFVAVRDILWRRGLRRYGAVGA